MAFQVSVTSGSGKVTSKALVDKIPDVCPICHFAVTPRELPVAIECTLNNYPCVEIPFQCPNENCQHLFIARYFRSSMSGFQLHKCVPAELISRQQSDTISTISPDFCAIYEQADKAERLGLVLVAGPGYRKALEFLIKDYIISQINEDDAAKKATHIAAVEKQQLGPCILQYIANDRIKEISKRAAWLGNDETHYVRKWGSKDLQDLKRLIALTQHWIEMEKHTAEIMKDMPSGKT